MRWNTKVGAVARQPTGGASVPLAAVGIQERPQPRRLRHRSGFTLVETLTYLTVLLVVMALAYSWFDRCLRCSRDLRRNADDIMRTVNAGERWREDVRRAMASPQLAGDTLRIPQAGGEVVYSFADGAVRRGPVVLLRDVRTSRMQSERRQQVTVWQWDVELVSLAPTPRVRPLFGFQAVAGRQL